MGGAYYSVLRSIFLFVFSVFSIFSFLYSSLWTIFFLVSCSLLLFIVMIKISIPRDPTRIDSMFGFNGDTKLGIKFVTHRACGIDAPENSIGALNRIIREGVNAVEFDVSLSSDKIPVVFHDDTLTRMADDFRRVNAVPFKELLEIDISLKDPRGKQFPGEKIPSFDSFIARCIEENVRMFIDLKGSDKRIVSVIGDVFKKNPELINLAVVSSFDPWLIYKIRAADPRILGCVAWRPYYYSHEEYSGQGGPEVRRSPNPIIQSLQRVINVVHEWLLSNFLYQIIGLSALLLHKDMISRDVLKYWQKRGVRVFAWTVNLPSEKIYFERCLQIPYLTDTLSRS